MLKFLMFSFLGNKVPQKNYELESIKITSLIDLSLNGQRFERERERERERGERAGIKFHQHNY